jgi:hypothetical protein
MSFFCPRIDFKSVSARALSIQKIGDGNPFSPRKRGKQFTTWDLVTARVQLAGFVEAEPDKNKVLREVHRIINHINECAF